MSVQAEAINKKTEKTEERTEAFVNKNKWAIRTCFLYKEEYNDCKSIKGRFHQYFIHGESVDCLQWKRDYDNRCRFEDNNDLKAAKEIIRNENTLLEVKSRQAKGEDIELIGEQFLCSIM